MHTSILHDILLRERGGLPTAALPFALGDTGTLLQSLLAQTPGWAHKGWAEITDLISRELLVTLDSSHCKHLKYELFLTREKSGFDTAQQ